MSIVWQILSRQWHVFTLLALAGLVVWLRRDGLSRAMVLILGMVAMIALSYGVQAKGFPYHFGGLLLVFCLLISGGAETVLHWARTAHGAGRKRVAMGALIVCLSLMGLAGGSKMLGYAPAIQAYMQGRFEPTPSVGPDIDWSEIKELVALVQANSTPQDRTLQWGRNFSVMYLAERRATVRFILTLVLGVLTPDMELYDLWMTEALDDIAASPPAVLLVTREDLAGDGTRPVPAPSASEGLVRIMAQMRDYELAYLSASVALFVRP